MKKFFTTTFACVLGVMIAGILLTLLSIAALTGMAGFDRNRIHSETKHYHEIGFRYRYRP